MITTKSNVTIKYWRYGIVAYELHALAGNGFPETLPMQPAGGDDLNHSEYLQKEIENLRERLSRLSRASLRIAGGLDLDAVLQGGQSPCHRFSGTDNMTVPEAASTGQRQTQLRRNKSFWRTIT